MRLDRIRPTLLVLVGSAAATAVIVSWVAMERRNYRLMMAHYHGALQVKARSDAEGDRKLADILDGKVDDPISPFLSPGDPAALRALAASSVDRAATHAGLRADYLRGASRPWEPIPGMPAF